MTSIGSFEHKEGLIDDSSKNVVIYNGDVEDIDITVTIAKHINNLGFTPVILGEFTEKLAKYIKSEVGIEPKFIESREKIIEVIKTSIFGIYRVHKSASADNFVALGVSIALNKSFLPIKYRRDDMPSDLLYLTPIEYAGFTDLERQLKSQDWLDTIAK